MIATVISHLLYTTSVWRKKKKKVTFAASKVTIRKKRIGKIKRRPASQADEETKIIPNNNGHVSLDKADATPG